MPIADYGVWKGKPISWDGKATQGHGKFYCSDSTVPKFETDVNVMSKSKDHRLVYWFFRDFDKSLPLVEALHNLGLGFNDRKCPKTPRLDYLRGGFLDVSKGRLLSHGGTGKSNDILDYLDPVLNYAVQKQADVYIYGQRYRDGDRHGMHDIHINQGNAKHWKQDNGTYQDGGIIFAFPDGHWEAIFLAFAVQTYRTDENGDPVGHDFAALLTPSAKPVPTQGDEEDKESREEVGEEEAGRHMSIEAALVNPFGPDRRPANGEGETVYLHNSSSNAVSLDGWSIANGVEGQTQPLHDVSIGPQSKRAIKVPKAPLSHRGGRITLKNAQGSMVHEVTYSKEKADREGVLVYF